MSDEGFHEIQLNGKQLVFLFMAATVVSVVIFLCGVMVGRGVRAERGPASVEASVESPVRGDDAPPPAPLGSESPAAGGGAPGVPPEVPADPGPDFEQERLTAAKPVQDTLRDTPSPGPAPERRAAAEKPERSAPPREEPERARTDEPASRAARNVSASDGFAVQLAALRDRREADAIVKRLAAKGYPAYVQNPLAGKPPVYRVQVGRYPTRDEAEKIAARLKSEEQFSPWIIR